MKTFIFRHPRAARMIFLSLISGFSALLMIISWRHKFTPAYDVMHDLGMELYTAPWVRVIPYLIGLAVGWYLQTSHGEPLPFTKVSVYCLLILENIMF